VQDFVEAAFQPLQTNPLLDGIHHRGLQIAGSVPYKLKHKLGRPVIGWITTSITQEAALYRTNQTILQESILELNSSTDLTVDVYVF